MRTFIHVVLFALLVPFLFAGCESEVVAIPEDYQGEWHVSLFSGDVPVDAGANYIIRFEKVSENSVFAYLINCNKCIQPTEYLIEDVKLNSSSIEFDYVQEMNHVIKIQANMHKSKRKIEGEWINTTLNSRGEWVAQK